MTPIAHGLELFPFRFRDPRTGKWIRARYAAEVHEIKERHVDWEILGSPKIREISSDACYFTPHSRENAVRQPGAGAHNRRMEAGTAVTVAGIAS